MNTMTRWLKNLLRPRTCDCEDCSEREWKSLVKVARFNHPWRSAMDDNFALAWWALRVLLWSVWTIVLARAVFNGMNV